MHRSAAQSLHSRDVGTGSFGTRIHSLQYSDRWRWFRSVTHHWLLVILCLSVCPSTDEWKGPSESSVCQWVSDSGFVIHLVEIRSLYLCFLQKIKEKLLKCRLPGYVCVCVCIRKDEIIALDVCVCVSDMSSANELTSMEVMDDIESLLFLCDRLRTRLMQVTSYVDEVKQTWMDKRQSIEVDSNVAPIIAQKAVRCNKVLLNVAEKLAVVELQTECLYNLQYTTSNRVPVRGEKAEGKAIVRESLLEKVLSSFDLSVSLPRPVSNPMLSLTSSPHRLDRDVPTGFTRPLNVGTSVSSSSTTATRPTPALLRESRSASSTVERPHTSVQRSTMVQGDLSPHRSVTSSQNLLTSRPDSVPVNLSNGSIKDLPPLLSNSLHSYSCL